MSRSDDPAHYPLSKATLSKATLCGYLLSLCFLGSPQVYADPEIALDRAAQKFELSACYKLVQFEGRMIAWARWEQGLSKSQMRSAEFRAGTPFWIIELVDHWISDAYKWQATDAHILQWARELGSVEDLPRPQDLTTPETIAIWMRRIAQHCDRQHEDAAKEAALVTLRSIAGDAVPEAGR